MVNRDKKRGINKASKLFLRYKTALEALPPAALSVDKGNAFGTWKINFIHLSRSNFFQKSRKQHSAKQSTERVIQLKNKFTADFLYDSGVTLRFP